MDAVYGFDSLQPGKCVASPGCSRDAPEVFRSVSIPFNRESV